MKSFKHALLVIGIFFLSIVLAIGCIHGAMAFFFHGPAYKKEIAILTQENQNTNTLNLELMRENTKLRRYCRWAAILELVLGQEPKEAMDDINKKIEQWKGGTIGRKKRS